MPPSPCQCENVACVFNVFLVMNPYLITAAIENRHWMHIFQHIHAKELLRNAEKYYNAVVAKVSRQDRQSVAYIKWKTNFKRAMEQWKHDLRNKKIDVN